MKNAPVVLFVYKRPKHLTSTIESLRLNDGADKTILYIFSEGPKPGASEEELQNIQEVRKIIREIRGFKEVIISEAVTNKGCAASMTSGISKVLDLYGKAIILEDDIITHPKFLHFCNMGLEVYENELQIKQIGGFMFPTRSQLPEVFLSKSVFCWGWATWKRAWDEMSMDAEKFVLEIKRKKLENQFDLDGSYPYMESLEKQVTGKIDAWDICWYASIFLQNGLAVYPGKSLTKNIGMDGSGTHFTGVVRNPISSFDVPKDLLSNYSNYIELNERVQDEINNAVLEWFKIPFSKIFTNKFSGLLHRLKKVFSK